MKRLNKKYLESLSPAEQQKYIQKFEQMVEYKRINPLFFYNHPLYSAFPPHAQQIKFHELRDIRSRAFFGGNQSGKTTCGIADDLIQAVDIDILPAHLKPYKKWYAPFKCRIFTPDLSDTMLVVQDKIKELCPLQELIGESWDNAYDKVNRFLRFKNGSWFQFMSYEQDIQKLGSATLHRIHFDEEPPKKVYEECQPRLLRYGGDQIFTMTPLQGMSWTYNDIWITSGGDDDSEETVFINEKEKVASVVVDMDDNPYLDVELKEDTLRSYDAATIKARKEGRFIHFAGMIYSEFQEHVVVKRIYDEKPAKGKRVNVVVGIDPGMITCAVLWTMIDEDNNLTVFDELYVENWKVSEVCEAIHKMNAYHEVKPIHTVIDQASRDKNAITGKSLRSEYNKHGVYTILSNSIVELGINEVKERLRDQKLWINGNCKNLIKEFKMYRFKEPSKRTEENPKAEPIKKDDHALDALRYICMSRPYAPTQALQDNRTTLERIMDEDRYIGSTPTTGSEFGPAIYS